MPFIPNRDEDFLDWSANLIAVSTANKTAWQIPDTALAALTPLHNAFDTALTAAKAPNHGKIDTQVKNDARDTLEHTERRFVNGHIRYNDNVPPAGKIQAGVPLPDDVPTPVGEPKTRPEFSLRVVDILRIRVDFRDQGSASAARLRGMNGALLCYAVADGPVTDYEALVKTKLLTDTPATLELPPGSEGKTLSCAMRWQSDRGVLGPWSEIQSIIIP